jgi:hypothetical protein
MLKWVDRNFDSVDRSSPSGLVSSGLAGDLGWDLLGIVYCRAADG